MKRSAIALVLVGCGHARAATRPAPPSAPPPDPAAFARGEDEILRDLAAIDRRFAKRAHVTPSEEDLRRVSMAALLHEDPTLAVVDGAIDPFSFDARARGLDAVKIRLAALPASGGEEHELLARVVDSEFARLDEERLLPRSASALIHGILDTWVAPRDEREAAEVDRWLTRRLSELLAAMTATVDPNATLDVVRARELDDVLDEVEKLATGLPKTTQALVQVRAALESVGSRPSAKPRSDWDLMAKRLQAQIGVSEDADALAADFAKLETNLRARAELALASAKTESECVAKTSQQACIEALQASMFTNTTCADAVPGSRLRSMAAPSEREPICNLRKLIAGEDPILALVRLHDHVVVASWALDVARGATTLAMAQAKHHLLSPARFDTRAHLERIALARPAAAIGAGIAVKLLVVGDPNARAKAWAALGDVPLDIAERELGAIPARR